MRGEGTIGLFARHRTAANLLMILMIASGAYSLTRLTTQFFPDFGIDIIRILVVWPGASAADAIFSTPIWGRESASASA